LEGAQRELVAVLGKLAELDYGKLFRSVDATLVSAQKAFGTLDSLLADLDELARLPDVRQAAANLREATGDLKGAIADVRQLVKRATDDKALQNLDEALANAARAFDRAAVAANQVTNLTHPDSRLMGKLEQTLGDLSDAARSLRRLADQLDRDPGALLRGRSP